MNLNKNLLTFVLMLFCGTWMCPQSADQVPIQDLCNENGIEILSPHYKSLRDGSWVAKPEKYIPENYQPSYFTVRSVKEK
jgi:hypothetical protein